MPEPEPTKTFTPTAIFIPKEPKEDRDSCRFSCIRRHGKEECCRETLER
jgi:hypothetical protein